MAFLDYFSKSVPVLMFHGVSDRPQEYHKPQLVCSTQLFEAFLKKLKKNNFQSISLQQLYDFKQGKIRIPKKSIVLTFDDGFLDNYVFAAPLLRKYGFSGILFVTRDFVEKNDKKRPTLEDCWDGKIDRTELPTLGYCSVAELQELDRSGVLEINAHSASHTWQFKSDKLVGVYKQTEYQKWLEWNRDPEAKPYQMTEEKREVPFGYPVFEFAPTLSVERVYFPDPQAVQAIIRSVKNRRNGMSPELVQQLESIVQQYPGRYETKEERQARYRKELVDAKKWLEQILEREVHFFAWPNGAYNKISERMAGEHYLAFQRPSEKITNTKRDPLHEFYRLGAPEGGYNKKDVAAKVTKLYLKIQMARNRHLYFFLLAAFILLERIGLIKLDKHRDKASSRYNFSLSA